MKSGKQRSLVSKGFTFEPRSFVAIPGKFGKQRAPLGARVGVNSQDPRFLAASAQHQLSFLLQEHLRREGRSVTWLASPEAGHPGASVDRVRRMLRGETLMQLADVVLITRLVPGAMEVWATTVGGEAAVSFQEHRLTKTKLRESEEATRTLARQLENGTWLRRGNH